MPYHESDYQGDEEFCIKNSRAQVVGDEVRFERAVYGGSLRRPKFLEFEMVEGKIVKENDEFFTIALKKGGERKFKAKTMDWNGTWRKPWANEEERAEAELHQAARGFQAWRVAKLLEQGVNPNVKGFNGKTPLYEAVRTRCWDAAAKLLEAGADPKLKFDNSQSIAALLKSRRRTLREEEDFPEDIARVAALLEERELLAASRPGKASRPHSL